VANAVSTVSRGYRRAERTDANMNDLLGARVPGVRGAADPITGAGRADPDPWDQQPVAQQRADHYIDGIRMESSVNSSSIGIGAPPEPRERHQRRRDRSPMTS